MQTDTETGSTPTRPLQPDNPAAFPLPENEYHGGSWGMSLRDYFAAHAPAEPPRWFEPSTLDPEPDNNPFDENGNDVHAAWSLEYVKQRYLQWPYAWADAMLRAREAVS